MRLIPGIFRSDRQQSGERKDPTLLYLSVYDLTPLNDFLYWLGLGVFHSGIEVYGVEYGFGAHDYPSSGIFEVEPGTCPGFMFRRSILLGSTDMSDSECRTFIENLASKYHGDTYHLIAKNCNHFTDEVCLHLTGKHIPGWVNRLAHLGSFFNCLLPEQLQVSSVRQFPSGQSYTDDELDSASVGSISEEDVQARDHRQLLTPTRSDVVFVRENSARGND